MEKFKEDNSPSIPKKVDEFKINQGYYFGEINAKNGNDSKNNSAINSRSGSKNRNKNENNVNVTETSKKRIRNKAEIISSNDKVEGNVVRKVRAVRRNQK